MLKLFQVSEHLFAIETNSGLLFGTRRQAIRKMKDLGIPQEEIAMAFEYFLAEGHNVADFGMYKSFIYSKHDPDVAFLTPVQGAA